MRHCPGDFRTGQESEMAKITVLSKEITVYTQNEEDYICLTDIAKYKSAEGSDDLIRNWLRKL